MPFTLKFSETKRKTHSIINLPPYLTRYVFIYQTAHKGFLLKSSIGSKDTVQVILCHNNKRSISVFLPQHFCKESQLIYQQEYMTKSLTCGDNIIFITFLWWGGTYSNHSISHFIFSFLLEPFLESLLFFCFSVQFLSTCWTWPVNGSFRLKKRSLTFSQITDYLLKQRECLSSLCGIGLPMKNFVFFLKKVFTYQCFIYFW